TFYGSLSCEGGGGGGGGPWEGGGRREEGGGPRGGLGGAGRRGNRPPPPRHSPGRRLPRDHAPIPVRTSLKVGWPTAAVMRRTCRLRPSVNVISSHAVDTSRR